MKTLGTVGNALKLLPTPTLRAEHKGREISKTLRNQRHVLDRFDVEVVDSNPIPGGIAVLARVFNKDGSQVAFGDGTVDIERFRFINPPILIPDGTTEKVTIEVPGGDSRVVDMSNFIEAPEAAILQALDHTIHVTVRHDAEKLVPGKVGSTVTTFYPAAGTGGDSCDLSIGRGPDAAWATCRGATTGNFGIPATDATGYFASSYLLAAAYRIHRSIFTFPTGSIPDTDVISDAVLSLCANASGVSNADSTSIKVVAATPADPLTLVEDDYDQTGATAFASLNFASWNDTDGTYNDLTLDANGIANIDKTGPSKFGTRAGRDFDNSAPTGFNWVLGYFADQTGTSKDPKLVVTHGASGPAASRRIIVRAG